MNPIKDELLLVASVTHCANRQVQIFEILWHDVAQFVSFAYKDLIELSLCVQ